MRCWRSLFTGLWLLGQTAQAQPMRFDQKFALATDVLRQVGATYGYAIIDLPSLVLEPRKTGISRIANLELLPRSGSAAGHSLNRSRLLMDEKLFDVCAEADKGYARPGTALAFVIAHEMAHFYLEHTIYPNFADRRVKPLSKQKSDEQEAEADQKGLLFAYLAGYEPGPILAPLFDLLYDKYDLKDPLPGHPTKAERIEKTKLMASEFQTYGYLFAMGHALYCREQFAEAARCFAYVYTRYPLREAYLNFGVCRLQEVIRLKKKTELSYFAMPFELDPRNRLLRLGERGSGPQQPVTYLLDEAKVAFERAITMSKTYQAAYLNLAAYGLLADNPYATLSTLRTWEQLPGQVLPPNAFLLKSIAHYALGEKDNAGAAMQIAVKGEAYQFVHNEFTLRELRNNPGQPLRQPWRRLKAQPIPGCGEKQHWLEEVADVPAAIRWSGKLLIDQNNPPPFIVVEAGRAGADTYLRADLKGRNLLEDRDLLFRLKR